MREDAIQKAMELIMKLIKEEKKERSKQTRNAKRKKNNTNTTTKEISFQICLHLETNLSHQECPDNC